MLVLNQRSVYSDKVFEAGEQFTVLSNDEKRASLTKFFLTWRSSGLIEDIASDIFQMVKRDLCTLTC